MYDRILEIEWIAGLLAKNYSYLGPQLEFLCSIHKGKVIKRPILSYSKLLVIQGSFDPPTQAHIEIIRHSLKILKDNNPLDTITLIVLLSLQHVQKKIDLLNHTLLGYRIAMLEALFQAEDLGIEVILGLSNVALYIDLNKALKNTIQADFQSIYYITGFDVFKKIFDSKYYEIDLQDTFSLIFKSNFIVPARNGVFSEEDFIIFLKKSLGGFWENYKEKIRFFLLPEGFRLVSSTHIRQSVLSNDLQAGLFLHPVIKNYIADNNLYAPTSVELAIRIAIQTIVRISIICEDNYENLKRVFETITTEFKNDPHLCQKVVEEYPKPIELEKKEIYKKWKALYIPS